MDYPKVSMSIASVLVVVFLLYITTIIKTIPCGKDLLSVFYSNFTHIDPVHIAGNLFALYALARVERAVGPKKFIGIVSFLLVFTTVVEVIIHKIFSHIPCSIGFSGVLFGITTWELVTSRDIDYAMILSIIILVGSASMRSSKVSLMGHAVGASAGVVGGIVWNRIARLQMGGSIGGDMVGYI